MPDLWTLLTFGLVSLVLVATPGPGLLYLVGQAAGEGRLAGFASMLGVEAGESVYVLFAAVGLSAMLARSTLALSALRYLGAVYLILIGIRCWRRAERDEAEEAWLTPAPFPRVFAQGFFVQLLNPKVALFFLAYFPQFVRAGHPVAAQVLTLGAVYLAVALTSDSVYVLLASSLAARLGSREEAHRRWAKLSAITYFALGVAAAVLGDRHSSVHTLGRAAFNRLVALR